MAIIRTLFLALLLAVIGSCNVTRVVKPLEKGEKTLSASFGGPGIIFHGAPLPLPLTSISYAQGLDTGLTLSAGIHTTSLAFGVMQADVMLGIQVLKTKSEKFGITASPGMHFLYDFDGKNFRNYPQLEALCWWQYGEKPNLFYGGTGTWVELQRTKAHGQVQQNEFLPWAMVGHQFNRPKWTYTTEIKYLGFQHTSNKLVVDYISPGNQGALGFYFGISRRLVK